MSDSDMKPQMSEDMMHGGTIVPAALVIANHGLGRGRSIKGYKYGHFSKRHGSGRRLSRFGGVSGSRRSRRNRRSRRRR